MSCENQPRLPVPWYLHPYFAACLSAVGAIASSWLLEHATLSREARIATGLLPVLPSAFLVLVFVRWIRGLDEMAHRIVFEAVSFAFVSAILGMMALEGLERAGVSTRLGWEAGWEAMAVLYVLGYAWARRRYR
jgi:hypothetical protein